MIDDPKAALFVLLPTGSVLMTIGSKHLAGNVSPLVTLAGACLIGWVILRLRQVLGPIAILALRLYAAECLRMSCAVPWPRRLYSRFGRQRLNRRNRRSRVSRSQDLRGSPKRYSSIDLRPSRT